MLRAYPRRVGCRSAAWSQGWAQAQDDREQGRIRQEADGQRRACQGRGQEPRRVRSYAVPLGASLGTRLAYNFFRFLRRPIPFMGGIA